MKKNKTIILVVVIAIFLISSAWALGIDPIASAMNQEIQIIKTSPYFVNLAIDNLIKGDSITKLCISSKCLPQTLSLPPSLSITKFDFHNQTVSRLENTKNVPKDLK